MTPSNKSVAKPKPNPSQSEPLRLEFEAIGTAWRITAWPPVTLENVERSNLAAAVLTRIQDFDALYSRFRHDSWVSKLGQTGGNHALPSDALPMLQLYRQLFELTGGSVTPLIGQTLVEAGYDANYSLSPKTLHRPPSFIQKVHLDQATITLDEPLLLDFGALGKGYLVDIIGQLLTDHNLHSYVVDAGGDMLVRAKELVAVGLENPWDTSTAIGIAQLTSGAICGSAGNRRAWGNYHHIIDPNTLTSPKQIAAIWVAAESAILADALTTALFFEPASTLLPAFRFEYAMVHANGNLEHSPDFPAEFFTS